MLTDLLSEFLFDYNSFDGNSYLKEDEDGENYYKDLLPQNKNL